MNEWTRLRVLYTSKEPLTDTSICNRNISSKWKMFRCRNKKNTWKFFLFLWKLLKHWANIEDLLVFVWCMPIPLHKFGSALIVPFRWIISKKLIHLSNILRPSKKDDTFSAIPYLVLCSVEFIDQIHHTVTLDVQTINNFQFSQTTEHSNSVKIHQTDFRGRQKISYIECISSKTTSLQSEHLSVSDHRDEKSLS